MRARIIRKEQNETWGDFEDRVDDAISMIEHIGLDIIDIEIKELHDDVVAIIRY